MSKIKKISIEDFMKNAKFSDDIYRQIFSELVSKHKNETVRQHLIRAVILIYERKYPAEMRALGEAIKRARENAKNKQAADKIQDIQASFRFPESLWNRLQLLVKDPPFLFKSNPPTKEELEEERWFNKQFPEFQLPEKI